MEETSMKQSLLRFSVMTLLLAASVVAQDAGKCQQLAAGNQNWKANIDWCIGNSDAGGSVDCPQQYVYPECIASGGRACLMRKAIQSAKDKDDANAYRQALVCQCHNSGAKDGFVYCAGQKAIADYLRTK
jgi:hypothetical protein